MATLTSNPTTVTVTTPGTSVLAVLAASMSSGQWANFAMGGIGLSLLDAGNSQSIIEFGAKGEWDPNRNLMQFWGQGHYAAQKFIVWDAAANQWSTQTGPIFGGIGHSYYHNAMNRATGDHYVRQYGSATVRKKSGGSSSWSTVTGVPNLAQQVAGGLEWHPMLNGGAGGLVFADTLSISISNATVSSWSTPLQSGSAIMGNYHNFAVADSSFVYCGGGNGDNRFYRVNANGTVTSMGSAPVNINVYSEGWIAVPHPNGQGFLAFQGGGGTGQQYFDGTNWSTRPAHQINASTWSVAFSIPEYGVIVFVSQNSSVTAPIVRVYKP